MVGIGWLESMGGYSLGEVSWGWMVNVKCGGWGGQARFGG